MKLIDRYIFTSLLGAFLVGVVVFIILLLAVGPLQKLMEMIAQQGVPAGTALTVFAYQLPYSLTLTFPMSVLLAILLVFGRMSSESEMVAIRAAGVSFGRILVPTLCFAVLATGATFALAEWASPAGRERAANLLAAALGSMKRNVVAFHKLDERGRFVYTVNAANANLEKGEMTGVYITTYREGLPVASFTVQRAIWDARDGHWEFEGLVGRQVMPDQRGGVWLFPSPEDEAKFIVANVPKIADSPFAVRSTQRKREDMRADEIRRYIAEKAADATTNPKARQERGEFAMELARRGAAPFACLAFALIAAPLGLRHHRTSSSVGVGISLLILLGYYFAIAMTNTIGESAPPDSALPYVAAWVPNILCAALGVGLIWRANQ